MEQFCVIKEHKITVMRLKLLYLLFFVTTVGFAQWSQVGNLQFSSFTSDADFTFDSNGTPYVVYQDPTFSGLGAPFVKKLDGTSWVNVGTTSAWGLLDASLVSIAINPVDNQPWVAWRDNNVIKVYRFDGTSWVFDSQPPLWSPRGTAPLEFVFNSNNEPVLYYHRTVSSTLQTYVYIVKQNGSWSGTAIAPNLSNAHIVTTSRNGETIMNTQVIANNNSSQVQANNATGGSLFTVSGSNLVGNRFNKLSMVNNYWVGNNIISATSGIFFGQSTNLGLPQPLNTGGNTGDYLKLVDRVQGNFMYLMYSDASNQLQIQRYKTSSSQWSSLPTLPISTAAAGFIVDVEVNQADNNLYVMYQDGGKLSMQKFTETPALTKYYVNANVSGGNGSGDSWTNAMTNLSEALSEADSNTTEIWVAAGTYVPGSARTSSFNVGIDGIKIYGGFDGTETMLSERDVKSNSTILSGDVDGDDQAAIGFSASFRSDNNYHVMQILNADNVIIDGFKINNGHANGSDTNSYAGGVFIQSETENLIFRNCEFNQNLGLLGGAIRTYLNVNTGMTFENCKFYNNYSRYGSGLYFLVNNSRTVTLDITNCLFEQNISVDQSTSARGFTGSALWARANGTSSTLTTTINNCTFANNLDRGTTASSQYGTLALSRRTDGNSTHTATINNSIFYFNDQGVSGVTGVSINPGHTSLPNQTFVNNSISEDNFSNLLFLTNTSNADPLFSDVNNNDFTLQTGSPAIDAGDNTKIPSGITKDLAGNDRILNTTVDMGAFEYDASANTQYTLTINATNGSVSTNPNPTNGTYTNGTTVTLTATPDAGYQFDGWSGAATGTTNSVNVTMDADKTVTAMFSKIQRTLTINATNGSVSTNPNPTNGTYDDGTSVTLTATPDAGYEFVGWSGDAAGMTNPINITMDADKTVTAVFQIIKRTLSLNSTNGTITASPNPVNGNYDDGTVVTLTAVPDAGYEFVEWTGDLSGTTNPINITMDADKGVTAVFRQIQRTLTINATNGIVTTNPNPTNGTYTDGTTVTLTAMPNAGYEFIGWSGDVSGTTNPLNITMDADKTVTAMFAIVQFRLILASTNGNISVDTAPDSVDPSTGVGSYNIGTVVELTATPISGYKFDGWSGDLTGTTNPISVTMNADLSVTAIFSVSTLGINEEKFKVPFKLYPNPVNDVLHIDSQEDVKEVKIYNSLGREVKVSTSVSDAINVSNLANGIYFMMIETETGKGIRRFIKR